MKQLNYQTLKEQGYDGYLLENAPERVLQFGEGNFLRAFVDYFIDEMNEKAGFNGKVVITQPIAQGLTEQINEQQGLYTLFLRGSENGQKVNRKRVISAVSRCINPYQDYQQLLDCAHNAQLRFIVSNTTEAGIVYEQDCKFEDRPPHSFPAKLTRFLYERYQAKLNGLIILSCELIDHNGQELKKCVLRHAADWKLGEDFCRWLEQDNIFCSTLVDRIVTGYPRAEAEQICQQLGYQDKLLDTGEVFGFWVIEGPEKLEEEFPASKAGLPILFTPDHTPYKQRKVRILNGAHTSMIMAAYLAGKDIVRDCMHDDVIRGFMNKTLYDEIIPTLTLPKQELVDFAKDVVERFQNPYIDHSLLAISLNSTAKWRARVMPSLLDYVKNQHQLPTCLVFSLAAMIRFYHNGQHRTENALVGVRGDNEYEIRDDAWVLDFYYDHRLDDNCAIAHAVITNRAMWDGALEQIDGLEEQVIKALDRIDEVGMYQAMKECL